MATHSNVLAWRIPRTEEPGGLPSMGLHRVGHDLSDLAAARRPRPPESASLEAKRLVQTEKVLKSIQRTCRKKLTLFTFCYSQLKCSLKR